MSELIEFRHLKYILAVAETANFTRAAERLFLSQPSLSKQIKDIETELGFQIFDRQRDGVFPTPIGQMIVDYAAATLSERLSVFKTAREIVSGSIPPLRVGFSCFVNSRHLHGLRTLYARHFPSCSLQLSGGDTVHILNRMERGDLDCAVLNLPISGPQWAINDLASVPLVACMRSDDPLAQQSEIGLEDLGKNLRVFRDPDAHPLAHTNLLQKLAEAGVSAEIACSAATPHDIQLLVRDGFGLALIDADMPTEAELTSRPVSTVDWSADTAFVHLVEGHHPALPYLKRNLVRMANATPRKRPLPERPQLGLKFDLIA